MRYFDIYFNEDIKGLVNDLKDNHKKAYKELYNNHRELLTKGLLNVEKSNDLKVKAIMLVLKEGLDSKFYNHNYEAIKSIVSNFGSTINLEHELLSYYKLLKVIPNHEDMSYEEIINFKFDEDKAHYEKDFDILTKLLKSVKNLFIYGNAGNGKTSFAYKMAKALDLQLYNINSVKNEYSVKGFFDLDGKYQKSLYESWYKNGGILLLDEVDSYSSNGMLYLNNGIEVNSKYLTLENGEEIKKHKDCYVIACSNTNGEGKTSDYVGRNAIDKAFMSRFTKKEFKEYAYIHKQIINNEEVYNKLLKYFQKNYIEVTTRLWVKIKSLLELFEVDEIIELLENKEMEL